MDWTKTANIVMALVAIYAAVLSTWTYIAQQRAKKPRLKITLSAESYLQKQDSFGQLHQKSIEEATDSDDPWNRMDVSKVTAVNIGQLETTLIGYGIKVPFKSVLFSEEIRGTRGLLPPGKRFEREIPVSKLLNSVPSGSIDHLGLRLVGYYQDETGNTYKSKEVSPDPNLKQILLEKNK